MMNKRTQRTRPKIKGQPGIADGSMYVGRPTRWGNRWKQGVNDIGSDSMPGLQIIIPTRRITVMFYYLELRHLAKKSPESFIERIAPLVGNDLCCWCSLDEICHADILLFFAHHFDKFAASPEHIGNFFPLFDEIEHWILQTKSVSCGGR